MKPQWPKALYYFLLILLFSAGAANAEVQSQYAVNDVVINASGKSPTLARTNAVASGQRNAFVILLGRLGVDASVASGLNDEAIDDMVASKQIVDEKIAGNNYSATLNLTFSESFVRHSLAGKTDVKIDVKEAATTQDSYLIIPVKIVKNKPLIWEENNDWKLALENIVKSNKISSVKLPKGDVDDISNFNPESIYDSNFSNFESILNKYKVDSLIFAFFEFDSIENKVNINLKTIRRFQTNQIRLDFVNVNQLTFADLANKVAGKTVDYILGSKNENIATTNGSSPSSVNIDVLISDLGDWLTVKNKLENSNIISALKINSISKDLVKVNVTYNNANGDIINFFARYNLSLQKKPEGGYFLSLIKQPN